MDSLPHWPEGTAAVLTTYPAHAIPVSLLRRAGDRKLLVGLAPRRGSLANLRVDPRCAVTVLAAGLAFTVHGRATAFSEPDPLVFVTVAVEGLADHSSPDFEISAGVAWDWTDDAARERDARARAALRERL